MRFRGVGAVYELRISRLRRPLSNRKRRGFKNRADLFQRLAPVGANLVAADLHSPSVGQTWPSIMPIAVLLPAPLMRQETVDFAGRNERKVVHRELVAETFSDVGGGKSLFDRPFDHQEVLDVSIAVEVLTFFFDPRAA